jgi:hypothetical protein
MLPEVLPNPVPKIVTWLPTGPDVAERLEIAGAGLVAELIETLSNVAVDKLELLKLLTIRPM